MYLRIDIELLTYDIACEVYSIIFNTGTAFALWVAATKTTTLVCLEDY